MLNAYLYLFYPILLHLARGFGKKDDENRKYFINRTTWVPSRAGQRGVSPANDLVVGPRRASVGAEPESCNSDDRCPRQKTGRSCWGSGQQDASDSEADAGCRNPSLFAEKAPCWPAHIALTVPRKIPWRCPRCVWRPWRTSPRRSSRRTPASEQRRPP